METTFTPETTETLAPLEAEPKQRPRNGNKGFGADSKTEAEPIAEIYSIPIEDLQVETFEYQDCPATLPHGFFVEGQRLVGVEINDYEGKTDLTIGSLYNGQRFDIKNGLAQTLPLIVNNIGGMTLAEIAKASSMSVSQLIEQMPLADALAILIAGRVHYVGYDISLTDKCDNCRTLNKDEPDKGRPFHNIGELKIGIIHNLEARLAVKVELEGGVDVLGTNYRSILMRPMRVYEISGMSKMPRGQMDWALTQASIFSIVGCQVTANVRGKVFSNEMFEALSGENGIKDRKRMLDTSEKLQKLSPEMFLSNDCGNCGNIWDSSLNWSNFRDFLFGSVR